MYNTAKGIRFKRASVDILHNLLSILFNKTIPLELLLYITYILFRNYMTNSCINYTSTNVCQCSIK